MILEFLKTNISAYINHLIKLFPGEKAGIEGIFEDMEGITKDISKFSSAGRIVDMSTFPSEFPYLTKSFNRTWGSLVDARLKNPKLNAIVSSLWIYFGLPPPKLSPYYYAMPTYCYLTHGGFYPRGKSQKISDAFGKFIEERNGEIITKVKVDKILTENNSAYGVITDDGTEYKAKERIADILIDKTEKTLLPGLRDAIEVKEIGTPLTNICIIRNYRGAVYGFDQTLAKSGSNRLGHSMPIKNLYLSGAWTEPGHGYCGVIYSGLQCFGEIMKN